jgi:hypothetical protein
MKTFIFSLGLIITCMAAVANAGSEAKDCILVELTNGATKLSNKCTETINVTWFYEGACSEGCSKQIGSKIKGVWADLFKQPYTMGVCYAPEKVDPKWKGIGPASCDTSAGKYLGAATTSSQKATIPSVPMTDVAVGIAAAGVAKTAKTDHKGEFQFQGLAAGEYSITVDGKPLESVTVGANGIYAGKLMKSNDGQIALTSIRKLTWK